MLIPFNKIKESLMGIVLLDSDFCIEGIDTQISQLFDYDEKTFFGLPINALIPDFKAEKYTDLASGNTPNIKETVPKVEVIGEHSFELEYSVRSFSQRDKTGYILETEEFSTVYPNIKVQKEGHEWLGYLLRSSPVVIYSCIPSGKFPTTFISENISKVTGYSAEEYLSDPSFWIDHLHPDDKDKLMIEMAQVFDAKKSMSFEYRFLCADGHYIWILDKLKISRNDKGEPTEMLGLWLDISDRKDNEQALKAANTALKNKTNELEESNAELSQFTFVVSHDLKAPLRAVHSYCDWLSEDLEGSLEPDQEEYITGMQTAVQQAEDLIEDLLELSRVGRRAVEVEDIPLTEFFNELVGDVIIDDSVKVSITDNMPIIEVSPTVLNQVFQNLITNAYTYNTSDNKSIDIKGCGEGNDYIVSITDNGIGIDERFHDRIFQLFQRLHTKEEYDGTGIGLAIVQKAVSHLHWKISLSSTPNKGSTFSISFPQGEIKK